MVIHESERELTKLSGEGIQDVSKRILAGLKDGYRGFLREFIVSPGGHTPYHNHDWYHLVYMLEGEGILKLENRNYDLRKGAVIFIESNRPHGFTNTGTSDMSFLCLVPENGDSY